MYTYQHTDAYLLGAFYNSGQFKGARCMYFVSRYPSLTGGCEMEWNFFGTGHGKGEWDGAGAILKRALRTEQLQNPTRRLQDAADAVQFLEEKLGGLVPGCVGETRTISRRYFHHISVEAVDRRHFHGCDTIHGSRKLHCIKAGSTVDPTVLFVRNLSCYCPRCLDGQWAACEMTSHVQAWTLVKLAPVDVTFARERMLEAQREEGEAYAWTTTTRAGLGDLVEVGDNFVVPAEEDNDEGVDFYILQCQRHREVVTEKFTCAWGGEFDMGQHVIVGQYYQKWGTGTKNYVYRGRSAMAHVDASLVVHCKFHMVPAMHRVKGRDPVYVLSDESLDVIMTVLGSL